MAQNADWLTRERQNSVAIIRVDHSACLNHELSLIELSFCLKEVVVCRWARRSFLCRFYKQEIIADSEQTNV
jgi:hypothetical protein